MQKFEELSKKSAHKKQRNHPLRYQSDAPTAIILVSGLAAQDLLRFSR
jgi:hypothetical protein